MSTTPYWVTWNPLQGALNAFDELFLGVPSNAEQANINADVQAQINQAAAGNTPLATSEYQQYIDNISGNYGTNAEGFLSSAANALGTSVQKILSWLPWIAAGLITLYLLPIASRFER